MLVCLDISYILLNNQNIIWFSLFTKPNMKQRTSVPKHTKTKKKTQINK